MHPSTLSRGTVSATSHLEEKNEDGEAQGRLLAAAEVAQHADLRKYKNNTFIDYIFSLCY